MKLLFDQNLSNRLVLRLKDILPNAVHVRDLGLSTSDDDDIWNHAVVHGFTIVSKDSDFRQRSFLFGAPTKVIEIALGICTTGQVEALLRRRLADVENFLQDRDAALLVLS